MLTIDKVKRDLRQIKNQQHIIQTYNDTKQQYEKRLEYLKNLPKNDKNIEKINKIQSILTKFEEEFDENKLLDKEKMYMEALNKLSDETDRVVLMKVYIQGKTYFKASIEMCYSFESMKKKLKSALRKLLNILNKKDG